MDEIIKVTSRMLFPIIMVFGIYIALFGHINPGGAFPAGVILASGFAILLLTHGRDDPEYDVLRKLFNLRVIGVLLIALFTLHMISSSLNSYVLSTQNFLEIWSGGYTIFMNNLSMFLIFTAFSMIIYLMVKQ